MLMEEEIIFSLLQPLGTLRLKEEDVGEKTSDGALCNAKWKYAHHPCLRERRSTRCQYHKSESVIWADHRCSRIKCISYSDGVGPRRFSSGVKIPLHSDGKV